GALFILGCGLAVLETAANPYAAELGAPATAASRLPLAQSLNGLGSILGPVVVGGYLFSETDAQISIPYSIMGGVVLIVAMIFTRVRLPEIKDTAIESADGDATAPTGLTATIRRLWSSAKFRMGVLALFCYEIAEISINSMFINYSVDSGWMSKHTATLVLSFGALGLFMVARIIGSAVMSRISAARVLTVCALLTVVCSAVVALDFGSISRYAVFGCYAFEAIMFPTIFAITISGVKGMTKIASSFLMMTPLGGAVGTSLMGWVAGQTSITTAFIVPCAGYLAVLIYARMMSRARRS
ncbi:MAG: MFS transporter, partial [Muribaculaceae bacterium]|nr:MFS transporter [Muribaculaceae bacterium]